MQLCDFFIIVIIFFYFTKIFYATLLHNNCENFASKD